jgi:uncharacterized protein (DUF302 family)
MSYYISKTVQMDYETAIARVTDELAREGFGILTEIDVRNKLHEKLGVEFLPYKILGACNPAFAHQALQIDERVGALMPCSVVVHTREDGRTEVAAMDPLTALRTTGSTALEALAAEARERIVRVLSALE